MLFIASRCLQSSFDSADGHKQCRRVTRGEERPCAREGREGEEEEEEEGEKVMNLGVRVCVY